MDYETKSIVKSVSVDQRISEHIKRNKINVSKEFREFYYNKYLNNESLNQKSQELELELSRIKSKQEHNIKVLKDKLSNLNQYSLNLLIKLRKRSLDGFDNLALWDVSKKNKIGLDYSQFLTFIDEAETIMGDNFNDDSKE